jgi:isopenicillin-N epimerase
MYTAKPHFQLDPEIHFLNHGSFGACPTPVFETYQAWQRRLERQPVLFLGREHASLLAESRAALGAYLNADPDDLVYIPNATHGVNIVARSLQLRPGDEILSTNHEYGACDYAWEFACSQNGAKYLRWPIPLPARDPGEILEHFWAGVTERTRVIYLSHITSPTALRLPVEAICQRARQRGILTVIDGAHAPGQIPLDLTALDADFYTGNCHKWMLAPKGAAFLYARRDVQDLIQPLVVSWGYGNTPGFGTGSRFVDLLQWTGTHDPSAYLSVPAAIAFMRAHNWEDVRRDCHRLLADALVELQALTGLEAPYLPESRFYAQMAIARLPDSADLPHWKAKLYDDFKVEIPLIEWHGHKFARISVQAYNTHADIEALLNGLRALM